MILRVPFRPKSDFWHPGWCESHRVQERDQSEVWNFFKSFFNLFYGPIHEIFQMKFIKKFSSPGWGNQFKDSMMKRFGQ